MNGAWLVAFWLGMGVGLVSLYRRQGWLKPDEDIYETAVIMLVMFMPPVVVAVLAVAVAVLPFVAVYVARIALECAWIVGVARVRAAVREHRFQRTVYAFETAVLGMPKSDYIALRKDLGERFTVCSGCRGVFQDPQPDDLLSCCSLACGRSSMERCLVFFDAVDAGLSLRDAERAIDRHPTADEAWWLVVAAEKQTHVAEQRRGVTMQSVHCPASDWSKSR